LVRTVGIFCASRLAPVLHGVPVSVAPRRSTLQADAILPAMGPDRAAWAPPRTVLVIDEDEVSANRLGDSFSALGSKFCLGRTQAAARSQLERHDPDLLVTELRVGGVWAFNLIDDLRRLGGDRRAVIATAYPSVSTAVRATQLGFDGYLLKPVDAGAVLRAADDPPAGCSPGWPSLDKTIWEYVNQILVSAGTMSEAARTLGLDRRSLRRMLGKYPPCR
jgi:ActR/RegA family two-component response regulator